MNSASSTAAYALALSCVAVVVSLISLGWNIYKEMGLRPRVRVSMSMLALRFERGQKEKVRFYAVNYGPGTVHLTGIVQLARPKRFGWREPLRSVVVESRSTLGNEHFPVKLEVGAEAEFFVPYGEDCTFLKKRWARMGIRDSFDRIHWIPRRKYLAVWKRYFSDFKGH